MEDLIIIFVIAISLAMDCFAVSLGVGCTSVPCDARSIFRMAFHFGFFQGGMAWLGWVIGNTILPYIEAYDHWIALFLLAWIGIRMIKEGLSDKPDKITGDPTRGGTLIMLSIATSIDALGVGLSLSMVESDVLLSGLIIGIVSTIFTVLGLKFGRKLNRRFGRRIEVLGGLILITIGIRLVITHMIG
ncbi:MAG: manganese efflux pump [Chloroflexi bacterium]|jgi:putative Mn2+ efflux pump MntP|nr:manganese efflux pump [Chloroflexota bacterium]